MISVCYMGTATDYSGYGNANRMDIASLFVSGVNLTTEIIRQVPEKADYGLTEAIAVRLQNRKIPYKIKILHITPDIYPQYMEDGKYHIGRLFFETSKLPEPWIRSCNEMAEIWTGTEEQKKMIEDSGVHTPVYLFPQAIDTGKSTEIIEPFQNPKDFVFYSIFQFILRKNPKALFNAYWKAFSGNDNVTLLAKTYGIFYVESEYKKIKQEIVKWKNELKLSHYPKVFLVHKLLTDNQMERLHNFGDVYVNHSASEGWGRGIQEAMLYGNPVISSPCGITDIMTPVYYNKIGNKEVQAQVESTIPWYTPDMKWKEIDELELQEKMKYVYEHKDEAMEKAKKAKDFVCENFSFTTVGSQMRERLKKISRII